MPLAKIILPKPTGEVRTTAGTKVMVGNAEIDGVSRIEIDMNPNDVLEAKITLALGEVEYFDELNYIVSESNFVELAERYGYDLVKK